MDAIKTDRLTKYYGRARGIEDISLHVPEGALYGFIGPNGAGKSTTIRTLLGFLRPTSGRAQVLGHDVTSADAALRAQVGYVPGEVSLYGEMRVREVLAFSAGFYPGDHAARSRELADALELDLDRRAGALSLGNRKKVSLVAALQHRPRLLILDEPTNGLDPLIQQRFFSILLDEHARGTTIFFSSHVLSDVQRLCQTVAIIRGGEILAVEDVAEVRARQLKRVHVRAEAEHGSTVAASLEALSGVSDFAAQGGDGTGTQVSFLYTGDVNVLLAALGNLTVADVLIDEPSLEEIFLQYYGGEGGEANGTSGV